MKDSDVSHQQGDPVFMICVILLALLPSAHGLFNPRWQMVAVLAQAVVIIFLVRRIIRQSHNAGQINESIGCIQYFRADAVYSIILFSSACLQLIIGAGKGASLDGLFRMSELILLVGICHGVSEQEKASLVRVIPISGVISLTVSLIVYVTGQIMNNPYLIMQVWDNGRLQGTFGYANSYAAFLMTGLIILVGEAGTDCQKSNRVQLVLDTRQERQLKAVRICQAISLSAGIVLTQSRGAVLCGLVAIIWMILSQQFNRHAEKETDNHADKRDCGKNHNHLKVISLVILNIIVIVVVTSRLGDEYHNSTIIGRLLYDKDAVRLLLRHPFGIGYLGWHYLQGMTQHGMYSVRFVHNELLQTALDYGIPAAVIMLTCAIQRWHRMRDIYKAATLMLMLHCLIDFDLQFGAMTVALVMLLSTGETGIIPCIAEYDYSSGDQGITVTGELSKGASENQRSVVPGHTNRTAYIGNRTQAMLTAGFIVLESIVTAFYLPYGIADFSAHHDHIQTAHSVKPWDTEIAVSAMLQSTDLDQAAAAADHILHNNPYEYKAWQILAEQALSQYDIPELCTASVYVPRLRRYDQDAYDYAINRLSVGLQLAYDRRDAHSIDQIVTAIKDVICLMDDTVSQTDSLASSFHDQPELSVDDNNWRQYVNAWEEEHEQ